MITTLIYNWVQAGGTNTGLGEDYEIAEVGKPDTKTKKIVKSINEHAAVGEGDKWYYDVIFSDSTEMRVFNPNTVIKN